MLPRISATLAWCSGLLVTVGALAEEPSRPDPRPNIVFAIADDWGWPHAGAYGDSAVKTPNFDRIAREGVLFTHAFVSSPSCTPSRGAILTGQDFFRLGAAANLWSVWPDDTYPEYPRLLEEAGYHVGSYRKAWGPGRGNPGGARYPSVEAFFEARAADQPFCFWFGAIDPHRPYDEGSGEQSGIRLEDVHLFGHFPDVPEIRRDVADYYYEVQRFDRELGQLIARLEQAGELDNTLIFVTGDHGMPFPRCKANLYDCGARVPLAVRWGSHVRGGRSIDALVSLTDIAPTLLQAAGLPVPVEMTGRSLLPILTGRDEPETTLTHRDYVLLGRERHVPAQEAPDSGGYPMRGLRTRDFLYIRNERPDRWPAGTPEYTKAFMSNAWLADCDNGATKAYLWHHREDPAVRWSYDLCFAKRPAEELYDLRVDPEQLHNVAEDPDYADVKQRLAQQLQTALEQAADPRARGEGDRFDAYPYLGSAPQWEGP